MMLNIFSDAGLIGLLQERYDLQIDDKEELSTTPEGNPDNAYSPGSPKSTQQARFYFTKSHETHMSFSSIYSFLKHIIRSSSAGVSQSFNSLIELLIESEIFKKLFFLPMQQEAGLLK